MASLSVIVPVYNAEKYLDKCVNSICRQAFTDMEIILVNDGSTDTSKAICEKWAAADSRIKVLHKENGGPANAVLSGLAIAGAERIGFVDADDWVLPEMFSTLMCAAQKYDADFVQCGALLDGQTVQPDLTCTQQYIIENPKQEILQPYFEKTATLYPVINARWNKVYRKDLLIKAHEGFNTSISIGEDLCINLRYLHLCKKVVLLKDANYYCYRKNAESLTKKYSAAKAQSVFLLIEELHTLADAYGYSFATLQHSLQSMTAGLMLDALLSGLPVRTKVQHLTQLYARLDDKQALLHMASWQPFYGKVAIFLLAHKIFFLPSLLTTLAYSKKQKG